MSTSSRQARKEIQGHFWDAWRDGLANGLPNSTPALAAIEFRDSANQIYTPEVFWPDKETDDSLPKDRHFLMFSTSDVKTEQRSMAGGRQQLVGTKYTTPGVGLVRLFFSKLRYQTAEEDFISAIAQECFLSSRTTNVWFRNSTIVELPPEEDFFRANVTFEYEYDTHR